MGRVEIESMAEVRRGWEAMIPRLPSVRREVM